MFSTTTFGTRPTANVDTARLNKVLYDIRKSTGHFNAANEPHKVRLHGFARKSTMGLRGGALEEEEEDFEPHQRMGLRGGGLEEDEEDSEPESNVERTNTLGHRFSPIIETAHPPAPGSLSNDELTSLDEGYSSGDFSPNSTSTPPTCDSEAEAFTFVVTKKAAKKVNAEKHITSTSATEVIPFQPAQHGQKKVLHNHLLDAQYLVAEYVTNARSQRNKKNKKKAKIVEAPRDVEIFTEAIAPVVSQAKAEAAWLAVANAQKAHAQKTSKKKTSKKTTLLTPSSVVVPTKSDKSPIGYNLAGLSLAQIKKLAIATRFVDRHNLAETSEATEILNAAANVGDNYAEDGIHVFIDASNINIGFMDALKEASGINKHTKCNANGALCFEPFAFILERGRKVAQKELVGSVRENEEMAPYMVEAAECGYDVSAPQIVRKLKTVKVQGMNKEGDADWTGKPVWGNRQVKKMAYTEQLVDELIHLKMATAILDYKPSTMVLATGDANVAEYSGGFAKYVNHALDKGWKVEVIAWKHGISSVYKKMKKANDWGESFKIIELDDYRHELTNKAKPSDWWAKTSA